MHSLSPYRTLLLQTAYGPWHCRQLFAYSTQFEEAVHVAKPSTTQTVGSPPITPDSSTGEGEHVSDGRSSQTTSAHVAQEPMVKLVHKVRSFVALSWAELHHLTVLRCTF